LDFRTYEKSDKKAVKPKALPKKEVKKKMTAPVPQPMQNTVRMCHSFRQ